MRTGFNPFKDTIFLLRRGKQKSIYVVRLYEAESARRQTHRQTDRERERNVGGVKKLTNRARRAQVQFVKLTQQRRAQATGFRKV